MMSPEPAKSIEGYLDRWAATRLSCEPADRATAEEGVRLAYLAADLQPPERIIWCGGPLEIAAQLASAPANAVIGANVRTELYCNLRQRVGLLSEIFRREVIVAAMKLAAHSDDGATMGVYEKCNLVSDAIHRHVHDAANEALAGLHVRARHLILRLRGQPRLLPRWSFEETAIGPCEFASLGIYEYMHEVSSSKDLTSPLRGLWNIGASAGWVLPHERVCWISERPSLLLIDARGHLHSADGPALRYRDGWSAYAWKGVPVPGWMIEHPEQITPFTIDATLDPVLREGMIDIMTPERFVRSGVPHRISEDKCGILWGKQWTHRGVIIGSWLAVEVINGTAEPDGSRKRYFLRVPSHIRTAQEAVAWTYGLTAEEYARLDMRT